VAGRAAVAEALEWEIEDFDRCLRELTDQGMVRFDRGTRMWFIPRAINHNPPANPNVVIGWRSAWSLLPEGPMRDEIAAALRKGLLGISEAFSEAFDRALGESSAKTLEKASGKASAKVEGNRPPKQEAGNRKQQQEQEAGEKRPRARAAHPECPPGVADSVWSDWLALRKSKRAPVTATVVQQAEKEAEKAGMTLQGFLEVWCARGSMGLQADWLKPAERGSKRTGGTFAGMDYGAGDLEQLTTDVQRRLGIVPPSSEIVDG
jgi:hypothetical protein